MLILAGSLLAVFLFLRFGPEIPFRRTLHKHLVATPADWLLHRARYSLLRLIVASALLVGCGTLLFNEPELLIAALMGGGDVMLVLGPELAMWYVADIALYLDALAVSYLLATASKVRIFIRVLQATVADKVYRLAIFRSTRHRRTSRQRAVPPRADNDDDGEGRLQIPLAA